MAHFVIRQCGATVRSDRDFNFREIFKGLWNDDPPTKIFEQRAHVFYRKVFSLVPFGKQDDPPSRWSQRGNRIICRA